MVSIEIHYSPSSLWVSSNLRTIVPLDKCTRYKPLRTGMLLLLLWGFHRVPAEGATNIGIHALHTFMSIQIHATGRELLYVHTWAGELKKRNKTQHNDHMHSFLTNTTLNRHG